MSAGDIGPALPLGWEIPPQASRFPALAWLAAGPVGPSRYAPNVTAVRRRLEPADLDSWADGELLGAKEFLPSLFVIDSTHLMLGGVEARMDLIIATLEGRHLTQTQYCVPPDPTKSTEPLGTVITSSCATVDFPNLADELREVVEFFVKSEI